MKWRLFALLICLVLIGYRGRNYFSHEAAINRLRSYAEFHHLRWRIEGINESIPCAEFQDYRGNEFEVNCAMSVRWAVNGVIEKWDGKMEWQSSQ